jgi:hypothetical protein
MKQVQKIGKIIDEILSDDTLSRRLQKVGNRRARDLT